MVNNFNIKKDINNLLVECFRNNFLHGLFYFKNEFIKNVFKFEYPAMKLDRFRTILYSGNFEILKICFNLDIFDKNYTSLWGYISYLGDKYIFSYFYSKFQKQFEPNQLLDNIINSRNLDFINYIFTNFEININSRGFQGYTPIHRAIYLNDEDLIDYLLLKKEKIDFLTLTDYDEDLLETAIEKNCHKIIKI